MTIKTVAKAADGFYHPASESQLVALVKFAFHEGRQLRVRGAAHSVSRAIYCDPAGTAPNHVGQQTPSPGGTGVDVMLDGYRAWRVIDDQRRLVEADAGMNLGADPSDPTGTATLQKSLLWQLATTKGWTLSDTGGITHQTVSGFTATGSAGGSLRFSVNDNLWGFRVIDGTGVVHTVSRDDPDPDGFFAMVPHLGLLGVVSAVTLRCVPAFNIAGQEAITTIGDCSIDLFADGGGGRPSLEAFLRDADYARIAWWPQRGGERAVVWQCQQIEPQVGFRPARYLEFTDQPDQAQLAISVVFTILGNLGDLSQAATKLTASPDQLRVVLKLLSGVPGLGSAGPILTTYLGQAIALGVGPALKLLAPLAPVLRGALPTLFPALLDAFVAPDSGKSGVHKGEPQSFRDVSWQGLPMDNQADDKLLPTEFTELWVPLGRTRQSMGLLNEYFRAPADAKESYRRTGTYAWELYAAMPTRFWLVAVALRRQRRVEGRRVSHRPVLVRQERGRPRRRLLPAALAPAARPRRAVPAALGQAPADLQSRGPHVGRLVRRALPALGGLPRAARPARPEQHLPHELLALPLRTLGCADPRSEAVVAHERMRSAVVAVKSHRTRAMVVLAAIGAVGFAVLQAQAAPAIPIPNPIVLVHTESNGVVRNVPVAIGGAAVPIDVDQGKLLGLLQPDLDVSVGLIAADELPGKPIVPTITVVRDPTAVLRHAPAPQVKVDVTVEILNGGDLSKKIATITYGYETPPGGRIPQLVRTKLLGAITGGFVDPLEATVQTPGYDAPLTLNAHAVTPSLDATFAMKYDPMPPQIHFVEDPRDDGLDFHYDHAGTNPDIRLDATAELKDLNAHTSRNIDASVDRLPNTLDLAYTGKDDGLLVDFKSDSTVAQPDVDANYRETKPNGKVATDANVKIAGLPRHLRGELRTVKMPDHSALLDHVDFRALDGGQIGAADFLIRNWTGAPGTLPEPDERPDQYVAVASRAQPDGSTRFRASGHLERIRSATFDRLPAVNDGLDVSTDIGDGSKPLHALLDLDGRGPGAPADAHRMILDTTISPLPPTIRARMLPADDDKPTTIHYASPVAVDVDARVVLKNGVATGCGGALVTCASAHISKLPPTIDLAIPGSGQTDFTLDHNALAANDPDVTATVDTTPADTAKRSYADVRLVRVPQHVSGRVDSRTRALTAAEFHTCDHAFTSFGVCPDATSTGLGRVSFTVRGKPTRAGLPPRPDNSVQHITLLARDGATEVDGRVDAVRNLAVHQRDRDANGTANGALGYAVDAGNGAEFGVKIDTDTADVDHPTHRDATLVDATLSKLPTSFSGCLRTPEEKVPPGDLPADSLLAACDHTELHGVKLGTTPLSVHYTAAQDTVADADVTFSSSAPVQVADGLLEDRTTKLHTFISHVPNSIGADIVSPIAPGQKLPARLMRVLYDASAPIGKIDLAMESRGATDACSDPRPGRETMCLSGTPDEPAGPHRADLRHRPAGRRYGHIHQRCRERPVVGSQLVAPLLDHAHRSPAARAARQHHRPDPAPEGQAAVRRSGRHRSPRPHARPDPLRRVSRRGCLPGHQAHRLRGARRLLQLGAARDPRPEPAGAQPQTQLLVYPARR